MEIRSKEIFIHPEYSTNAPFYDVAVILTEPLNLTDSLLPVCLPEAPEANPDTYSDRIMNLTG